MCGHSWLKKRVEVWPGWSYDSTELRALLQGAELSLRALGGFYLKVRPAVGIVNSDPEFKSVSYCIACYPSQQMVKMRIFSVLRLQGGQEPTAILVQCSLRPGFTLKLLYI